MRKTIFITLCPHCHPYGGNYEDTLELDRLITSGDREDYHFICLWCWKESIWNWSEPMNGPVIENPDFEGGFYYHEDKGELQIANGWRPWFLEVQDRLARPEYKIETQETGSGRVHSGNQAQKMFTSHIAHNAGLYQHITVEKNNWYKFTGWVYVWSSMQHDPDTSIKPGAYHAELGASPWGKWATDYATIWGKERPQDRYNEWIELEVIFQAWHDTITLFTRGHPEYNVVHNDSYWDDLHIEEISAPGQVTPGPTPTPTPGPVDFTEVLNAINEGHTASLNIHAAGHRAMADVLQQEASTCEELRKEG